MFHFHTSVKLNGADSKSVNWSFFSGGFLPGDVANNNTKEINSFIFCRNYNSIQWDNVMDAFNLWFLKNIYWRGFWFSLCVNLFFEEKEKSWVSVYTKCYSTVYNTDKQKDVNNASVVPIFNDFPLSYLPKPTI